MSELRLFVYGSLMQGEVNARELAGARYLGSTRTAAAYTLVDLGPYPALLPAGAQSISGELYAVDAPHLARLDAFEDHPAVYFRSAVRLEGGPPAEAYFFPPERAAGAPVVRAGDWRSRTP